MIVGCHYQPFRVKPQLVAGVLLFLLCGCHGLNSNGNFPPTKIYLSEQSNSNAGKTRIPIGILLWARNINPQINASYGTLVLEENNKRISCEWHHLFPAELVFTSGVLAPYRFTIHKINRDGIGVFIILSGQW